MIQPAILAGLERVGHLVDHGYPVPVLEWPHALEMKKGYTVAIVQEVAQVGLEARHGAQVSVDEGDSPRLGGHLETRQ